jgi:hypothetical protein
MVFLLFLITVATLSGQMKQMSDSDLISSLSSSQQKVAVEAALEIFLRGPRVIPQLLSLRNDKRPYLGGGLGSRLRSQIVFDNPTGVQDLDEGRLVTCEIVGLYLLVAIFRERFDFSKTPFLVDLRLPEQQRRPSTDSALIDRGWDSAMKWMIRFEKEGIKSLQQRRDDPLKAANVAFW